MKTTCRLPAPYAEQFLKLADDYVCDSPARPERFMTKKINSRGGVSAIPQNGLDEAGLERKNPVIGALGDSVTAGHFESLLPKGPEKLRKLMKRLDAYISRHFTENLKTSQLCAQLEIGRIQLYKRSQQLYGRRIA